MKQELNDLQIIAKRNNKIDQKRKQLDYKYSKMLNLRKEKLDDKKKKEFDRIEKKRIKLRDIELHNLTGKRKKKVPVDKTVGKVKAKALTEIQLYAKLHRAVKVEHTIVVYLYDLCEFVPLDSKVNGGHVFSQKNYPQLAFDIDNIRPISSRGNRKQLDTTAERIVNLWEETQKKLIEKSKNKLDKNDLRDRQFYLNIIQKYKTLNDLEKKRLGISS